MHGVFEAYSSVGFLMKAILNHITITKISESFVRIFHDSRKCFNLPASGTFAAITAFCPYTGSVKTRILAYFMQLFLLKTSFLPMNEHLLFRKRHV